jgi:DNA-binding MarR family transcriptional regulator
LLRELCASSGVILAAASSPHRTQQLLRLGLPRLCDAGVSFASPGKQRRKLVAQEAETRKVAQQLLRFLEEMMEAIVRVDLGDPAIAQLSLLELRLMLALGDAHGPISLRELARCTETSIGQGGQATERLRSRGLAERRGGGRGAERAFAITRRGRALLRSLEAGRRSAIEGLISRLAPSERLRVEGAAHLLGDDLDRLTGGLLAT